MNILALDVATKTGYAYSGGDSGTWNFGIRSREDSIDRIVKFHSQIKHFISNNPVDIISIERTAGRFKKPLIVQSELHGVLKLLARDENIVIEEYSAKDIKKFATDNGNASKSMMIEAAEERFGIKIIDDNHADALWLLERTKQRT